MHRYNRHQVNQNRKASGSLTRSSRMETGKSNMHIFTGWARALCRLNTDLVSILPDGDSAGCCPGACFIFGNAALPRMLSLIRGSLSLPFNHSLPERVHSPSLCLSLARANCSPLSHPLYIIVTNRNSTDRNLQLLAQTRSTAVYFYCLGKKSELLLDLLPTLPCCTSYFQCLSLSTPLTMSTPTTILTT